MFELRTSKPKFHIAKEYEMIKNKTYKMYLLHMAIHFHWNSNCQVMRIFL